MTWKLLLWVITVFAMHLIAHILQCRLVLRRHAHVSPQFSLVKLTISMNVPLLLGSLIAIQNSAGATLDFSMLLFYAFLTFNALAYAYFHFFNMSETARRIRMVLELKERGVMAHQELSGLYSSRGMIESRLERLTQMGQIMKNDDGQYVLRGRLVLNIAKLIRWYRRFLGVE